MTPRLIGGEVEPRLGWAEVADAIEAGHRLPAGENGDMLLSRGEDALLSRAAWIPGLGALVKTATVMPGNPARGRAAVNGAAALFDDGDGRLSALIDFHLLTRWKTAADSLLGARHLARRDAAAILIVGAGEVAGNLRAAYGTLFPGARFAVWARRDEAATAFARAHPGTDMVRELEAGVRAADVIACATMAREPLIRGAWLRAGQHLDLVGSYRADMREADDEALARARVFADCRPRAAETGEIARATPPPPIVADFRDIAGGGFARRTAEEITLFKNAGGAHLDLIVARHLLSVAGPAPAGGGRGPG